MGKRIAVTALVLSLAAFASLTSSASPAPQRDNDEIIRQQVYPVNTTAFEKVVTAKTIIVRPAPLVLPDIPARTTKFQRADRQWLAPQLKKSRQVVEFLTNPKRSWMLATRHDKCFTVPWQRLCTVARAKLRLNHALAEIAQYRLEHELPLINDWLTAVRYVCTKIYPGTCSQLRYLSDREGGWGRWIWYSGACSDSPCLWRGYHVGGDNVSGADTVGGWMQFRWSTFAPYWRHTLANLKARGYEVPHIPMPPEGGPVKYAPWLSPLGQALTAGYMHWSGRAGCHWCL